MVPFTQGVEGLLKRTQNFLQFHDCRIGSHPLVHCMFLARVAGIEEFGILVVVVRHVVEDLFWSSRCRA